MRKIEMTSKWRAVVALTVGLSLSCGAVFAQKQGVPTNQRDFDLASAQMSGAQRDALGHAFDNGAARLFWFTDLEKAKAQAKIEGKPILSLRLLGNLTDEYSCANSRFFRVIFYPQEQINPLLRDKFVLHWSRERPVPVVTIDMGDGRQLKRTLTGNSAHYLLNSDGKPLDVMPSVVTPARFAKWLESGAQLNADFAQTAPEQRDEFLTNWHRTQLVAAWREIDPDQAKNDQWISTQFQNSLQLNPLEKEAPARVAATFAAPLAVSKVALESPILDATRLFGSGARVEAIRSFRLGAGNIVTVPRLDEATRERIKAMNPLIDATPLNTPTIQNPYTQNVGLDTGQKRVASTPLDTLIRRFEFSIWADDSMSLGRFQIPIHASFVEGKAGDFASLNRKIYDRLFLTPKSDPWLGLAADGVFTGLQNGGILDAKKDSAE